jgi:hypothetical protein
MELRDLLGKDLSRFKVIEMAEVYKILDDGFESGSFGFLPDEKSAKAFTETQNIYPVRFTKIRKVFILTDGTVGFLMGQWRPVTFLASEKAFRTVRKKIKAKLAADERKPLHLE